MIKAYKKYLVIIGIIGLFLLLRHANGPSGSKFDGPPIDPSVEPVQIEVEAPEPIKGGLKIKDGIYLLNPKASYKIAAKVCGKRKYRQPWQSYVAPYDFCLMWGRLAVEDLGGDVKFENDMRWYHFRVKRDSKFSVGYVADHSANTHLLPANKNIKKAIGRLGKGDVVELDGYLVYLEGTYKGQAIYWNSSLQRQDSGNGACEVMYVNSVRVKNKIYY